MAPCRWTRARRPCSARATSEPVAPDALRGVGDRDQLEYAFTRLSLEQRAVVVLHYYMGLTLAEIAETLDLPPGTVNSRLARALERMRIASRGAANPGRQRGAGGMSMSDHEIAPLVRAWLEEPISLPEHRTAHLARIVHETPRQRHLWPSIHSRRPRSMFSASRVIVASLLVALVGSTVLIGLLSQPSRSLDALPAAEAHPVVR